MDFQEKYPGIVFRKRWEINGELSYWLGQCKALVDVICTAPLLPTRKAKLLRISVRKGVMATTAIEGNTLTEKEVEAIMQNQNLPKSKEYQQQEVTNVLEGMNWLLDELINNDASNKQLLVTNDLVKRLHFFIGKNLGEAFEAIPGQFAQKQRVVGNYRCPSPEDVPGLMEAFANWLRAEFHYQSGQTFTDVIIQAIVSHLYLEWIHPFDDGNGRTGRLLEVYILMRGGLPDIASHIMANHYNETRSEYYFHIKNSYEKKDLSPFLRYAIRGLLDGLKTVFGQIQEDLIRTTWEKFVRETFDESLPKIKLQEDVKARRRKIILSWNLNAKPRTIAEQIRLNRTASRFWSGLSSKTIERDIKYLVDLGLLLKEGAMYRPDLGKIQLSGARRRDIPLH